MKIMETLVYLRSFNQMTKKVLIYALITFCMSVFFHSADTKDISSHEINHYNGSIISTETVISSPDGQFALTRPTNQISIPRTVSQQAKRPFNYGNSGNSLLKDGKLVNIGFRASYNTNLYRFPSGLKESTHRFISLGKIII